MTVSRKRNEGKGAERGQFDNQAREKRPMEMGSMTGS